MSLRHALLAAIHETAATGYELNQRFEERLSHVWSASHQQIYRELARLETQGLLVVEIQPQAGKPDRKRYTITAAGIEVLQGWLGAIQARPAVRDPLLLKCFAGDLTPTPALLKELAVHEQTWRREQAIYRQIEARYFSVPPSLSRHYRMQYLALRRGLLDIESWLVWAGEVRAMLEQGDA